MNIYWMNTQKPSTEEFAWCAAVETWGPPEKCSNCGSYIGCNMMDPFVVEWERGATRIGDFTDSGSGILVNRRTRTVLENLTSDFAFGDVHYRPSKFKKATVQADEAPQLWWLTGQRFAHLDIAASKLVESDRSCEIRRHYQFKYEGLVVPHSEVTNAHCFHIHEFGVSRSWFCTEEFVSEVRKYELTNIRFEVAGEVA